MSVVTENKALGTVGMQTKVRLDRELDAIRVFHEGPLQRCSQCGRLVFHPCHACETVRKVRVHDPFDTVPSDWDELRIELQGKERQRYEHFRLQKVMDETAKNDTTELITT